jgi:hypothetical protein
MLAWILTDKIAADLFCIKWDFDSINNIGNNTGLITFPEAKTFPNDATITGTGLNTTIN